MTTRILALLAVTASAGAAALEGQVVNSLGEPIVGAVVQPAGSQVGEITDAQGRFFVPDNARELHVTAPGYSHKSFHAANSGAQSVRIELVKTVIDQIDVIGLPIHASVVETALPVAVLTGAQLRKDQAATLGDSLENQLGVNTNFHGNVASTPVIRGLSGPRVLITQNSMDVSDVSRVGPDHAVASEVSTATQVEILRGPATLFYGSGAIGGVINIVDRRIPVDDSSQGELLLTQDTVNNQRLASFNASTAVRQVALYADGFRRESDDYQTPVDLPGGATSVANSAESSSGYTLGGSYLLDTGYVGIATEQLDRQYGIPGHSHGHESETAVYADLQQQRVQLTSELHTDFHLVDTLTARTSYTDYVHAEIENGVAGTVFANESYELRLDVMHRSLWDWNGGVNLHYKRADIEAVGEEAFTPPSSTETFALALIEERHLGDWLVQLGARVEQVSIRADRVLLPDLALFEFGDHSSHQHTAAATRVFAAEHVFTPLSFSAGVVWNFATAYNLGVALSHASRAPTAVELLSFGQHIGTRTYEVGALFARSAGAGNADFNLSGAGFDLETSNNVDLTFRKYEGELGIIVNAFYNQIDDYYFQKNTGLFVENHHDHDHDHDHDHAQASAERSEDALPVMAFTRANARFYGVEAQAIYQLVEHWKVWLMTDYVHAELTDGSYLPRTPPLRVGLSLAYEGERLHADLSWTRYADQHRVAERETPTAGYNWLDAHLSYDIARAPLALTLVLKAENLADAKAQVHSSFIKDVAPRPGRNFSVGLYSTF